MYQAITMQSSYALLLYRKVHDVFESLQNMTKKCESLENQFCKKFTLRFTIQLETVIAYTTVYIQLNIATFYNMLL